MGHLFGREPEGISEDFNQRGKKPIELLWWWWLLGQLNSRHSQLLHQWVIACFSEALNWMRFVFLCSLDCQGWKRPQRSSSSIPQQSLSPGCNIFISRSSRPSSLIWTDRELITFKDILLYDRATQWKLPLLWKWTLSLGPSHMSVLVLLLGLCRTYLPALPQKSHGKIFRQLPYCPEPLLLQLSSQVCITVCLVMVRTGCCNKETQQYNDLKNKVYFSFPNLFWTERSRLSGSCTLKSYSGTHVPSKAQIYLDLRHCCHLHSQIHIH